MASETAKVKLSKSKSCGRLSSAASTGSGAQPNLNQNNPTKKGSRQRQSGNLLFSV
jgi:hypothetical protein